MSTTNLETILATLSTALEAITPDYRPNTRFKRWTGSGPLEAAADPMRERAFQFRLGPSSTPRTLSSQKTQWHRNELQCVVGHLSTEPRQADTQGIGFQRQAMIDERQIANVLGFGNPLSGTSNVKRMRYLAPLAPDRFVRIYRLDLEWAETF